MWSTLTPMRYSNPRQVLAELLTPGTLLVQVWNPKSHYLIMRRWEKPVGKGKTLMFDIVGLENPQKLIQLSFKSIIQEFSVVGKPESTT